MARRTRGVTSGSGRGSGDPTMGVALVCLVLCAMVADVHATITIKAAPGSAAPQIVILGGGPARPSATDDGRKLPASLKRYACTSLDGPACGETSTTGSGAATTISGAELQKLFAEAIARAALDSVAKALGSAERDTTLNEEATIAQPAGSEPPMTGTHVPAAAAPADAPNSGAVVAPGGGDAAAGGGAGGAPALDAAATLKTTTVKQTDDATGVTTTSSSTSATTASGHTIQTQIQIQSEGATGVLSADQREALFRQINEQVGSLFAQQQLGAGGGAAADGVEAHVQSFAFMIPEAGGADDVDGGVDGGVDGVAEVEIVDTGLLFADDDELLEHAEQLFDSGVAAANGAAPLRTGVGAGAAVSRRPPPPQRQQQRAAAAGPGPTSTAADAPPNSASRARSSKAVDLAPDRTVAAPGAAAGAGTAADDRAKAKASAKASAKAQRSGAATSQRPRGEAQAALHEATLTGPQLSELRSRSASGSVGPAAAATGAAAGAAKAGAKAGGAGAAAAKAGATTRGGAKTAAAAAPKAAPAAAAAKAAPAAAATHEAEALDDSKSHILQLFELFQKQTEQQHKQQPPAKAPPKPAAPAAAAKPAAAPAGAAAAAPAPQRRP